MNWHRIGPARSADFVRGHVGSRHRRARFAPGLEPLEGRALPASLEIVSPGGVWGLASVGARSDTNFVSLGTTSITPGAGEFFVSVNFKPFDSTLSGSAYGSLGYKYQSDESAGTATLSLLLDTFVQAGSTQSAFPDDLESELGTSLGGNPGDWITVEVTATGDEMPGDPVVIDYTVSGFGSGAGAGVVTNRWEAAYDADDGQGEQVLFAREAAVGSSSGIDSEKGQLAARVGDSLRFRLLASSRAQAGDQIGNGDANITAFLQVKPAPRSDIVVSSLAWNARQGGVDFQYQVTGADLDRDATVALYWSKGPNESGILSGPIATQTVRAAKDYPSVHVAPRTLGLPPKGATHLLAVADHAKQVAEASETNNVVAWKSNLSGLAWLVAKGVSQESGKGVYPNYKSTAALAPAFRGKVEAFIAALKNAGAQVTIESTRRDPNRAYLMYYAWQVSRGKIKPSAVPSRAGVDIRWDYGDDGLSKQAAQQMVKFFGIAVMPANPAKPSRHTGGLAIDMKITWKNATLLIKKKNGTVARIGSTPRDGAGNVALRAVGASYGVFKLASDAPHWSSDGH